MIKDPPMEVRKTFEKLEEEFPFYIQLRFINNTYCVYKGTSKWDKVEKKVKKITEHLGIIKKDGTFKKKIPRYSIRGTSTEVFEYGNCALAYYFVRDVEHILKELTSYTAEIIAYAIIKVIDPKPLKLLSSVWGKLYLSNEINVSLSPKHISGMLKKLGVDVSLWYRLFTKLVDKDDILLYDLTKLFTHTKKIKIAERACNTKRKYLNQIGMLMAFSSKNTLPIGMEIFPGSMKETKVIRDYRKRYPNSDIGYIYDRGFTDYNLLDELKEDGIHYITPLKKDSEYMDFRWVRFKGPFIYRKRLILWGKKECDRGYVYLFDDPKVRGEQETSLLKQVDKGEINLKQYEEKKKFAGIIGIISDLNKDGPEIYDLYKGREDIELAFDALNNSIDSDKSYLRSVESVRGYYFVSFIALRIYFNILRRLRERKLTNKYSVGEILLELSKVIKIKEKNGREYFAKIPDKTEKIMKIFPEVFNVP